jgi:hypothetical protein
MVTYVTLCRMRLLAALVLAGCGPGFCQDEPDFVVSGMPVCVQRDPAPADDIDEDSVGELVRVLDSDERLAELRPVALHFERLGGDEAGAYAAGHVFLDTSEPCSFAAAPHEWGHMWLEREAGDRDDGHAREDVFGEGPGAIVGGLMPAVVALCELGPG